MVGPITWFSTLMSSLHSSTRFGDVYTLSMFFFCFFGAYPTSSLLEFQSQFTYLCFLSYLLFLTTR